MQKHFVSARTSIRRTDYYENVHFFFYVHLLLNVVVFKDIKFTRNIHY